SDGDLVIAGAADFGALNGGVDHYYRKHSKANLSNMWSLTTVPSPPVDTTTTPAPKYWYCVATDTDISGNRIIYTGGDLTALLISGNGEACTAKTVDNATLANPTGSVTEVWKDRSLGGGTSPARGRAIGVDGNHNVFVAGFCTGTGLDSFIIQY